MKTKSLFMTMILLIAMPGIALQAQDKKEWISPEAAAKVVDFQLQGEYLGKKDDGTGTELTVGLQLIALGGGNFRAVTYVGGLPGAGWSRGDESDAIDGKLNDQGQLTFTLDDGKGEVIGTLKADKLTITTGDESTEMKKVARKSPTMGKAAPKGAVVLFDGTKEAAKNNFQRGQIVMENLLRHDVTCEPPKFPLPSFCKRTMLILLRRAMMTLGKRSRTHELRSPTTVSRFTMIWNCPTVRQASTPKVLVHKSYTYKATVTLLCSVIYGLSKNSPQS